MMQGPAAWRRARWILALVGLCALATCPAAQRQCATRRASREAPALLTYLVERVRLHATTNHVLPDVTAGPTPAVGTCCASGTTCAPDATRWQAPGWRALGFSVDGPHRFSYQVRRDGAALVLTAIGDQDCDGVLATFEVRLTLDGERVLERWSQLHPLE